MENVIAGAVSGAFTRCFCQPLDVVKIRFQLQSNNKIKYKNILQTINLICKTEGLSALWKGHVPAQLLSITYGSVQFGTFEYLSNQHEKYSTQYSNYPLVNLSCGFIAGGIATIVSFPFDVVRTRLVAQEKIITYKGVFHAFIHIYRNNGFLMFYYGLTPTVLQAAPNAGAHFMFYKMFKKISETIFKEENTHINKFATANNFICGSMAGVQGMKLDTGISITYKNVFDCFFKTIKNDGVLGLFKGLSPSLLKAMLVTGINFHFYELTLNLLKVI